MVPFLRARGPDRSLTSVRLACTQALLLAISRPSCGWLHDKYALVMAALLPEVTSKGAAAVLVTAYQCSTLMDRRRPVRQLSAGKFGSARNGPVPSLPLLDARARLLDIAYDNIGTVQHLYGAVMSLS